MKGTRRIAATIAMAAVCLMMCLPVFAASTRAMPYDEVLEDAADELSKAIGQSTVAIVATDGQSEAFAQRLSKDLGVGL